MVATSHIYISCVRSLSWVYILCQCTMNHVLRFVWLVPWCVLWAEDLARTTLVEAPCAHVCLGKGRVHPEQIFRHSKPSMDTSATHRAVSKRLLIFKSSTGRATKPTLVALGKNTDAACDPRWPVTQN